MSKLKFLSAAAIALAMVACGSSNSTDGGTTGTDAGMTGTDGGGTTGTDAGMTGMDAGTTGGAAKIDISGTASPHPIDQLGMMATGNAVDFTNLKIAVVDPGAAITNPNAAPLASSMLNTTNCTAGATGPACAWSFSMVDISNVQLGLVAELTDARMAGQEKWIPTATGFATGATVAAEKQSKAPITNGLAFGVTVDAEAALAAFVDKVNNNMAIMPGGLTAKGFMIGTVVDPSGMPIQGATVQAANGMALTIYYPAADFMSNGTSTSSTGTFIAVPTSSTPSSVVTQFTVTASGHTFPSSFLAGSNPGSCFVLLFQSMT